MPSSRLRLFFIGYEIKKKIEKFKDNDKENYLWVSRKSSESLSVLELIFLVGINFHRKSVCSTARGVGFFSRGLPTM